MNFFLFLCQFIFLKSNLSTAGYAKTYYVSTTGSDSNNGSESSPFQTLNRARNEIRSVKKSNNNKLPKGGILVQIRGGDYYQLDYSNYNQPLLQLNASDSGDIQAPIVYSSYQNEKVNIIGGYKIPGNAFKPSITYPNLLVANLSEIDGNLFKNVNYGNIQSSPNLGFCGNQRSELFVNQKRMILSRYPNVYYNQATYPNVQIFNWTQIQNVTNNQTSFTYKFDNNRAANWNKEVAASSRQNSPWVHGYWEFDWAESYTQIESIDISSKTINTYNDTLPIYGYNANARYYGVNLLCELDSIDEYYFDIMNHLVYINKLRSNTLTTDEYYISINPQIITVTSSSHSSEYQNDIWNNDEYIQFVSNPPARFAKSKHLMMRSKKLYYHGAVPDVQYITFANLSLLYAISNAISIYNGGNITLSNVTVSCIGEQAIHIDGYNNSVVDSAINNIGCGGIDFSGGIESSLTRGNNLLKGNHITYYDEWIRTYNPAIRFSGVGNDVINNYVGFSPHFGISGSGNDFIFKQNTFERLCYETSDSGGWYSGRSWAHIGHHIDNNTFIDIYNIEPIAIGQQNVHGIHLDDQMSYINITNNLFIDTHYGVRLGGGRGVNVQNNKFAPQLYGVAYDNRGMTWQKSVCQPGGEFQQQLQSYNYQQPPWSVHYPFLVNVFNEQPCVPVFDVIKDNVFCCVNGFGCHFVDDSNQTCASWNSTCNQNPNRKWSDVC